MGWDGMEWDGMGSHPRIGREREGKGFKGKDQIVDGRFYS